MFEYLQQLGQAILDFFAFIAQFISDLAAGITYVGSFLADSSSQIYSALSILPTEFLVVIMSLVSILTALAIVRWIT